jgi:hypothetical protein
VTWCGALTYFVASALAFAWMPSSASEISASRPTLIRIWPRDLPGSTRIPHEITYAQAVTDSKEGFGDR